MSKASVAARRARAKTSDGAPPGLAKDAPTKPAPTAAKRKMGAKDASARAPAGVDEAAVRAKPAQKRREQQRAIDTRQTILKAALSEFSQVGFEAASIRNIAAITGLQHPLITYHFRTKEILWKAVAEDAFSRIRTLWDEGVPDQEAMTPIERLRAEYFAFLRFTVAYPDFHHFMLRESRPGNPRLPWLVDTILLPTMERLLPQIESAQERGELPAGSPVLIHYMMIGMTSVLSSLKEEIHQAAGIVADSPPVVDAYLQMIDTVVFRAPLPLLDPSRGGATAARKPARRTRSDSTN